MDPDAAVQVVLKYFDGCNTGDLDQLKSTLAPDVVHYFLMPIHSPIRGADHLARYWVKFKRVYAPTWRVDRAIASGNEVVGEWSCAYTAPTDGSRRMFRGTEWYVIEDGRISEVRAYYQYDDRRDCQLGDFSYADHGYLVK
jgi:ketosteroid isomerase-like protein